jgi:hypothetical protein
LGVMVYTSGHFRTYKTMTKIDYVCITIVNLTKFSD